MCKQNNINRAAGGERWWIWRRTDWLEQHGREHSDHLKFEPPDDPPPHDDLEYIEVQRVPSGPQADGLTEAWVDRIARQFFEVDHLTDWQKRRARLILREAGVRLAASPRGDGRTPNDSYRASQVQE